MGTRLDGSSEVNSEVKNNETNKIMIREVKRIVALKM